MRAETVVGEEFFREARQSSHQVAYSPCAEAVVAQNEVESVLRDRAREVGLRLSYRTEMESFAVEPDAVRVVLRDAHTGERRDVRSRYLVAADGHRSAVRAHLGIPVDGPGTLVDVVAMSFRADLSAHLAKRPVAVCYLQRPRPGTVLTMADRPDQWALMVPYHPDRGERPEHFTEARCVEFIRAAVGDPELAVAVSPGAQPVHAWQIASWVARTFRRGRVLLAGDAAHVMPPTGGLGGNTGVQDAHNLAWKLAAVLAGQAGEQLLDSYDQERRPVAAMTAELSRTRQGSRTAGAGEAGLRVDPAAVAIGYRYRSAAMCPDDLDAPAPPIPPARLRGEIGTRAPHIPLVSDGQRMSSLDLFGRRFVLLVGPAAATVAESATVTVLRLGRDVLDPDDGWDAYGVGAEGACLVRPDGFVAWRAAASPDSAQLSDILSRCLVGTPRG